LGWRFHQINDIDHPDFQIGQMLGAKNGKAGQKSPAWACRPQQGHHHIRLGALVIARPLPDANARVQSHGGRPWINHAGKGCLPATTTLSNEACAGSDQTRTTDSSHPAANNTRTTVILGSRS